MFENLKAKGFEVELLSHAAAILEKDFPDAVHELDAVLGAVDVPITEIIGSGGGETHGTQRMRRSLAELGWRKVCFQIEKTINGTPRESISHEVDHVKTFPDGNLIALEIEWNNKDPFFDRDLENFKRLHSEGAISIGGIITRGTSLQAEVRTFLRKFADSINLVDVAQLDAFGYNPTRRQRRMIAERAERTGDFRQAWVEVFANDKYGEATTHWRKLQDRVLRGVGNPCPLVLIGIPGAVVSFDGNYSAAEL